jgi:HJR/Mrr/RecB family endonuclease
LVYFDSLHPILLEQSVSFGLYICLSTTINHEKVLDNIRHRDLYLAARITLIAILVWEIQKSQDDATVLSENWNRICYVLFSTKSSTEFGKVFYKKVLGNFISFPTV